LYNQIVQHNHIPAIKIIRTPLGAAPREIRDAWIGLTIPIVPAPKKMFVSFRTFSDGLLIFVGIFYGLFGIKPKLRGYVVDCLTAFQILEQANPEAEKWWRKHTPHLFRPGRKFVFDADCCELTGEAVWPPPPSLYRS